jgi:hypothetical protein
MPKHYHTLNPFDWMEAISLQGKANFFERRVGEYQKSGEASTQLLFACRHYDESQVPMARLAHRSLHAMQAQLDDYTVVLRCHVLHNPR